MCTVAIPLQGGLFFLSGCSFQRPLLVLLSVFSLTLPALLPSTSSAQSGIQFEHVSAEHNLSNDAVYAIMQDRHGFIWIGTEDGLNRFDGYEMITFRNDPADPGSISYNWVRNLHEDDLGRIWVAHNNGLDLLDPETGQFENIQEFHQGDTTINLDVLHRIYEDSEGGIWLGGIQIIHFDPVSQAFTLYPLETDATKKNEIEFFGENGKGQLLAGSLNGLFQLDRKAGRYRRLADDGPLAKVEVRGGHFDRDGNLWIAGLNELLRLNTKEQQFDTVVIADMSSLAGYLGERDIVEEESGQIWVGGTAMGLLRVDPGSWRVTAYRHDPEDKNSIAPDIGTTLFVDRNGSLWIGGRNGLDRLPANLLSRPGEIAATPQFDHFQVVPEATASLDQKMIRYFLKDRRGNFWIGTYDGLYKYRQDGRELVLVDHLNHDPSDPGTLSGKDIRGMLEDRRGDIWVATRRGLNRIDGQSG